MAEELEKMEVEETPVKPSEEKKTIKKASKKKVKRNLKPLSIKMTCSKCGATVYHTLVDGKYRCNVCGNLTSKRK